MNDRNEVTSAFIAGRTSQKKDVLKWIKANARFYSNAEGLTDLKAFLNSEV